MGKANQIKLDFDELAKTISRDLSLVYSLLRLINSAAFGLKRKVHSIKHALVLLGEKEIRKWISLLALQNLGPDKPDELIRLSLIRARFAELIAAKTQCKDKSAMQCKDTSDELFFAGLFSLLDVILNKPLSVVLNDIEASDVIKDCLFNNDQSTGKIYKLIIAYEQGQWNDVALHADALNIDYKAVSNAYINALLWYNEIEES
jgi:EAL and modified HD-GYP domain-containing signal transduction protein